MKNLLITLGLLFLTSCLYGQLKLIGNWGYSYRGNEVCIYGDKLANNNTGGHSGTLKLALYATRRPYKGGSIYGYCLAETKMSSTLSGGEYFYNIRKETSFSYPSKGTYCLTLLLLEYNNGYKIVDWRSFDKPVCF